MTDTWSPQPGMQQFVIDSDIEDIFIGAGRGAGATDVAIAAWLKHRERAWPGASGLFIVRHPFQSHWIVRRMREIYEPTCPDFTRSETMFRWPDGSSLRIANLHSDYHLRRLAGLSVDYLVFDDTDTWTTPNLVDELSLSVFGKSGVPCKRILTGHPPADPKRLKSDWRYKRYVEDRLPLKPFTWDDPGSRTGKRTSVFVPANVFGNEHLSGYEEKLRAVMDDDMRRAWLYGEWVTP